MKSLAFLFCLSAGILHAQTTSYQSLSNTVFKALKKGHTTELSTLFDTTGLARLVRAQSLQQLSSTLSETGKAKKLLQYWEDEEGCKTRTASLIEFKKEKLILYILFNAKKQIQQLHFGKALEQPFYEFPQYKGLAEVTDLYFAVKTDNGLSLPANISFSDTAKKIPLVIFVHGSGPNDRDETMGPNKCFKDLAIGLSKKGIAGLRYDKRTYAYQFDMKPISDSITIYDETINDAVAAVNQARQFSFVDTNRIYIIGHSQGAMCAPKIAELNSKVKAIVMMAGPARSLIDLIPEQVEYMAKLDDSISTKEQMQITAVNWMVSKIKSPSLDNKTPSSALMGASAMYWNNLKSFDQVGTAKKLTLPVFILNGERDYQVSMKEFALWQDTLAGKPNVQFKSYPKLNHLFMEGEGKPNPSEYAIPKHIPQYVIDDLADFILKH